MKESRPYSIEDVTLPTQVLSLVFDTARAKGVTEQQLLEGTGLLHRDLLNQGTLLRYEQILKMMGNALKNYPEPGLGLVAGCQEKISTWGLLGFAMMSQKTLADALNIANTYYYTSPALIDLEIITDPANCHFRAYSPYPIGDLLPMAIEELGSCIQAVFTLMLGKPFSFSKIEVSYDRPSYAQLYHKYFNCPVHYNRPVNHLYFDPELLDSELVNADSISAQMSEDLCRQAMERQGEERDLISDIRRILTRTPGRFPSMEWVAEELQISPRSLRRGLADQKCSFQGLLDEVRTTLAISYLESSKIPLDDIASLVGFTEYNNFRKAFKRWTGNPPSYYRSEK